MTVGMYGSSSSGSKLGRHRCARGFTLLETIIVLGIMGLMAVIAVPWFRKITQRSELRSDAYQIQAAVMAARMSAVKHNATATVTITIAPAGTSTHRIDTVYGAVPLMGTPTPIPTAPAFLIAASHLDFVATPAGGQITFRGDGTLAVPPFPTPGVIIVSGPAGVVNANQITIQADPNGRVRVITPVNWN